jgi:hypothetical protein
MPDLAIQPGERPRDHLIRVRRIVLAKASELPGGDTRRAELIGFVRAAETFVVDALTQAADYLILALVPDDKTEGVENEEPPAEDPWACEEPEVIKAVLQEVIDGT